MNTHPAESAVQKQHSSPQDRQDSSFRWTDQILSGLNARTSTILGLFFAFMVPLAVILFFFLSEIGNKIAFSAREIQGLEQYQGTSRVLEKLLRQRLLTAYNLATGSQVRDADLDQALHQEVESLREVSRSQLEQLELTADWDGFLNGWNNVRLQGHSSQLLNAASQDVMIQQTVDLIEKVGDTSNLILDPELDSHDLVNGLINILPQLAWQRTQTMGQAMQLAASGRVLPSEDNQLSINFKLITETYDRLWKSLDHAGHARPELKTALQTVIQQNRRTQQDQEEMLQTAFFDRTEVTIQPGTLYALEKEALGLQFELNHQMALQLKNLLERRVEAMQSRRNLVALLAVIMVAFSVYVVRGFMHTMRRQQGLEANARLISTVFSTSGAAFFIADSKQRITGINPAFQEITGYELEDVLNHPALMLAERAYDNEVYRGLMTVLAETGQWKGELFFRRRNNQVYPVQLSITVLTDAQGMHTGFVGSFADISEKKEFEHSLLHLVHHDVLTGLPNRVFFEDRVRQALTQQQEGRMPAVLFLNLDHFKQINEGFGHATGDLILCEVATRLKGVLCEQATVARQGGDEFMILLPDAADWESVAEVAQKLLDILAAPFRVEDDEFTLMGSIGVALAPRDGSDVKTLLKNADTAVSRAKHQGRNTFQFYTAEMNAVTLEKIRLENELRHAISRKELVLHYQPQVDLQTGQVVGVEALIRWHHPTLGMVSPGKFIPLAEESGLIVPIGEWVLREACHQSIRWQTMGLPELKMSVNLSALQFKKQDVEALVRGVLQETGLAPHLLDLEFTESLVMEDTEHILSVLAALKGIGVKLSVDDFGTGYSSLSYLKRFPVDTIKIDRAFVQSVDHGQEDAVLARAIIALARSMNLKTVAEGVETLEQLTFLLEHQCDEVQGFYFSRPLPVPDLEQLLRRQTHFEWVSRLASD